MQAGVSTEYALGGARSSRWRASGWAAERKTAIVQPVEANVEMRSPSGTDAEVRVARRVTTTLWLTWGMVSSRRAMAAAAERDDTPGTISNERSYSRHQSICSWMAP